MLVVLVEPGEPANIGAAARALKTMGLSRLALVRPQCDPHSESARWLAHGAHDVLAAAASFSQLSDATHGCALTGGFTARPRRAPLLPQLSLEAFLRLCRNAQPAQSACVFGSEAHGLTNDDLALCTHLVTIPHAASHPSLNLAQAVMVACYEWYRQSALPAAPAAPPLSADDVSHFIEHARAALHSARATHSTQFLRRLRASILSAPLSAKDLRVLHALLDLLAPQRPRFR